MKKRTIRLTESQLTDIVRKAIKESKYNMNMGASVDEIMDELSESLDGLSELSQKMEHLLYMIDDNKKTAHLTELFDKAYMMVTDAKDAVEGIKDTLEDEMSLEDDEEVEDDENTEM